MISKPFFETACYKCGCVDEAKFVFSTNGAVKQVCLHCDAYSGRRFAFKVTYILHGGSFGIEDGYCVMSLNALMW